MLPPPPTTLTTGPARRQAWGLPAGSRGQQICPDVDKVVREPADRPQTARRPWRVGRWGAEARVAACPGPHAPRLRELRGHGREGLAYAVVLRARARAQPAQQRARSGLCGGRQRALEWRRTHQRDASAHLVRAGLADRGRRAPEVRHLAPAMQRWGAGACSACMRAGLCGGHGLPHPATVRRLCQVIQAPPGSDPHACLMPPGRAMPSAASRAPTCAAASSMSGAAVGSGVGRAAAAASGAPFPPASASSGRNVTAA